MPTSTCTTRSTSATPPAAKWRTTSPVTAKAVLISAVPPMVQTGANPVGLPKSVSTTSRPDRPAPFYGLNRPGAESDEAVIDNWWGQGMMGGAKAHYDGIVAFSQTDFAGT
jgi:non-heme chloroperoxidase